MERARFYVALFKVWYGKSEVLRSFFLKVWYGKSEVLRSFV